MESGEFDASLGYTSRQKKKPYVEDDRKDK
jgi:hypothetical protein